LNEASPLYEKVKQHITDGIVSGEYSPGSKLPSESELVASLAVSRMTVNRALRELTRDGVVFRVQGVGSFVSEVGPNTSLVEVRDIRDIIADRGGVYSCKIVVADSGSLDETNARLFGLDAGQTVHHLVLVHLENGQPLQLEQRFVRKDFAPSLLAEDFTKISLFRYLHAIAPISELEHVVEAALPDPVEQEGLGLDSGQPVLRLRRRTWVGRNVVTLGYFSHPGERYRVAVRLRPSDVMR
jgi:GntR family transcriptional regulator, histidine utilization repressor